LYKSMWTETKAISRL